MRTHAIIVPPPLLDDDLCLAQGRKYLPVQQFVAQPAVEALNIAVLPRAAALDVGRARTDRPNPPLHGLSNELRPLVRADMARHPTQQEQVGQRLDYVHRVELARHFDRQALACELVADAIRSIGVTEVTYYRWRSEYGGMKLDQVKRLKELEVENARLRKAVSDLTLDKLILKEAARGNF